MIVMSLRVNRLIVMKIEKLFAINAIYNVISIFAQVLLSQLALPTAAQSFCYTRCVLERFYRCLSGSLSLLKVINATAHKLALMFYCIWRSGRQYFDSGMSYCEQKYNEQILENLRIKVYFLGLKLIPIEQNNQVSSCSQTFAI